MIDKVQSSFDRLEQYCRAEEFRGWDPYDGLTSKVFRAMPVLPNNQITRLMWIQFIKKMPVNLRGILKIDKGYNPKGLALFISGYSELSKIQDHHEQSIDQIKKLADKVILLSSKGYSGNCWGYNFDWQARIFFQKKNTPTIVATTFVANALLDAYQVTKNESYLNAAISSIDFIIKDLNRTYDIDGNFAFSYSPFDKTSVFNASLLGARLLSRIYTFTNEKELLILAKKTVAYCCNYQNQDGSWFYSTQPYDKWVDSFHTGFMLECIYEYGLFAKDDTFTDSFTKGIDYYLTTFFDDKGRSKYYNNSLYPIDIHAPSQLIITLSKSNLFEDNIQIIDKVTKWTIENMQSSRGYFYFQKRKCFSNKIPYMRWSQAWMFCALAHYIRNVNKAQV